MSFLAPCTRIALPRSAGRLASQRLALLSKAPAVSSLNVPSRLSNGAIRPSTLLSSSLFSTSSARLGSGVTDVDLASRLTQELNYEKETQSTNEEPDFLRDFKSTNIWTIQDLPGSDEISLEREFGNEKIKVLFSIGDIDTSEGMDFDESEENEDSEEKEEEEDSPAFPVRCAISITKPKSGALTIDAQAENGIFRVENISFYKDHKLATELTAEADWKRRGLYIGPQFPTLDDELQAGFESYLEERGINEDLALFVPLFAEYKEQKEYFHWLGNVKNFVEA